MNGGQLCRCCHFSLSVYSNYGSEFKEYEYLEDKKKKQDDQGSSSEPGAVAPAGTPNPATETNEKLKKVTENSSKKVTKSDAAAAAAAVPRFPRYLVDGVGGRT